MPLFPVQLQDTLCFCIPAVVLETPELQNIGYTVTMANLLVVFYVTLEGTTVSEYQP